MHTPAGLEMQRPLSTHWSGTLAMHCQRTRCMDENGRQMAKDAFGAPLTLSGKPYDDMMLAASSFSYG